MRISFTVAIALLGFLGPGQLDAQPSNSCGLLVMAHGGSVDWNAAIEEAVYPLHETMPTEIAFGMANPVTLQSAISNLESRGVECIAVVRLFMSAHSFLHQTEFLLGLRPDPPPFVIPHSPDSHGESEGLAALTINAEIKINRAGLMDAPTMGQVLAHRATTLSDGSGRESVLLIAHGPGDDDENQEWLAKLDRLADDIRALDKFETVAVQTLREDWDQKRAAAEEAIRSFVETESKLNRRVLVIPFRLFGFGPYKEVLEGLTYHASGVGLLPSDEVTEWIREQASKTMTDGGW